MADNSKSVSMTISQRGGSEMQKVVTTTGCGVTYYRGCFRAAMAWPGVSQEHTDRVEPLSEKKQDRREATGDYLKNGEEGSSTC